MNLKRAAFWLMMAAVLGMIGYMVYETVVRTTCHTC